MRTFACLCILLTGLAILPAAEPAEAGGGKGLFTDQEWTAAQRPVPTAAGGGPGLGTAATMLGGLVLVVAVAVALGWAVKRLNARKLLGGKGRHLEVLETVTIGPRRSLALVRCGTHWLVVGLGERELISVATLPAPAEGAAPAVVPVVPAAAKPSAFANELGRLTGGQQP
jgi:flagellar protein FliO/FliZ